VLVNFIRSVFSLLFSLDDLWMQAFFYESSAINLHSVAALWNIIYSDDSLYISFCILFTLMLP
jgi:hypothetical protein